MQGPFNGHSNSYDIAASEGCPALISNSLWREVYLYIDFLKVFLLILGGFLVFAGRMISGPALCIAGYLTVVAFASMLYYFKAETSLKEQEENDDDLYTRNFDDLISYRKYFLWSSTFGTIVGFVVAWADRIGLAILSGWGGLFFILILQEFFVFHIGAQWLFWLLCFIGVASSIVASVIKAQEALMLSTCSFGAYITIRSINCMAGYYSNYYNEFLMVQMKDLGLLDTMHNVFYAYIVLFLVLVALGFWVQHWTLQRERAQERVMATKVAQKQQQRKRLLD